jgi:hypothetical protein
MRFNDQINEPEYVSKKLILVNQKAELKGKVEAFEHNRMNRFEPAIAFVKEAKRATLLLAEKNPEKNRDFPKTIGSNLQLAEKSLSVVFKNPWKIIADFNSKPVTSLSHQHKNSPKSNWRRERDSNPRYL